MVSTPNAPDGLFEKIEREPDDTCLYKRLFLDYTYGLGRIYSREEIDKAKTSPSFEREYNLKYLGLIGNVFHYHDIEAALDRGSTYHPDQPNRYAKKSMGIDPGWGSSPFGIVITQCVDELIQILYAEEFERPDFNEMLNHIWRLTRNYDLTFNNSRIFIDGANPSFIRSLKTLFGENPDYEEMIARYKRDFPHYNWIQDMFVIPVNFSQEHRTLLIHAKMILEGKEYAIAIKIR